MPGILAAVAVPSSGGSPSTLFRLPSWRQQEPLCGKSREPYVIALILIGLSERQKAVHWLEQSYREGSLWSLGFSSDPILAQLRNDPHYRLLLSKVS